MPLNQIIFDHKYFENLTFNIFYDIAEDLLLL